MKCFHTTSTDTCLRTAGCSMRNPARTTDSDPFAGEAATDLQDVGQKSAKKRQKAGTIALTHAQVVVSISPVAGVAAPSTAASATPASSTTAISFSGRVNLLESTAVVPGANA